MCKYNFSAGPAKINESVLKIAKENILEYNSEGISILELSHRSTIFHAILNLTKDNLRKLLGIPPTFKILFLQGGATFQNTFIGNNIDRRSSKISMIVGECELISYR